MGIFKRQRDVVSFQSKSLLHGALHPCDQLQSGHSWAPWEKNRTAYQSACFQISCSICMEGCCIKRVNLAETKPPFVPACPQYITAGRWQLSLASERCQIKPKWPHVSTVSLIVLNSQSGVMVNSHNYGLTHSVGSGHGPWIYAVAQIHE